MSEQQSGPGQSVAEPAPAKSAADSDDFSWLNLIKVVALPLVTLILGFVFNSSLNERQARESNMRLYAEMMGQREQSDSDLRKDMFKSILDTFMSKDPKLERSQQMRQAVLNLELLAYNFHESLDIGPLFKDLHEQILEAGQSDSKLRERLEKVAREVIERQLTVLSDTGAVERGDAVPDKIDSFEAYLLFGRQTVVDPLVKPGEGPTRLCLSMFNSGVRHYRQFKLELIGHDRVAREVKVRLFVSKVLDQQSCERADLDLVDNKEIDSYFTIGLFDFPMIDNTRLSHGERCAVSLTVLTPSTLKMAISYFPGSRASLKEKPYYDEVMDDLVRAEPSSD